MIVDARCLQDPAYRERGIGQHAESLLRNRPSGPETGPLIGVTDPKLPPPLPRAAALFDRLVSNAYAASSLGVGGWFINLSPMTHDPLWVARLLTRPGHKRAAIIYDFIPHDLPDLYLRAEPDRLDYYSRLAWLGSHDLFLPISHTTAGRLQDLVAGAKSRRSVVTGVAVRGSLLPLAAAERPVTPAHLLAVAGPDPRKNVEAPIVAHASSAALQRAAIPLLVAGGYPADQQQPLRALHARHGGQPELLEFLPHLTDAELQAAYTAAFATIAPSRAEGFSIPVIEAGANGCPVLAANCGAQAELVEDAEALFAPDDTERLQVLMERVTFDNAVRTALAGRQAGLWRRFTEAEVAATFWVALAAEPAAPAIQRGALASIAMLSPVPPDRSGVANYTQVILGPLAERAQVTVYTEAEAPLLPASVRVERLSPLAHLSGDYDAVVAVMGNSHFHLKIFHQLLEYGGACIAHDARMVRFYVELLGYERARAVAEQELDRSVAPGEIEGWLHHVRTLPTYLLSEIVQASSQTFMHSRRSCDLVGRAYGAEIGYLPFAAMRLPDPGSLQLGARAAARARLHLPPEAWVMVTFGFVTPDTAPHELIWALSLLRRWKIPAILAFVGAVSAPLQQELEALARELGLADGVRFHGSADDPTWRSWLQAADAAVQLCMHRIGSISVAVMDCLTAGVPVVANDDLADALEAPAALCWRVPDNVSAVLIAERLADIAEAGLLADRNEGARAAYVVDHSADRYVAALLAGLGLG
ncbi:glycosyltransferase [Belnapia moabensis]|uniref:glycosyltransferase n=1 Tax=Belnapia moabensis TaxID=365533 RepID=UPI001470178F|nr:glycosyltransferase [Belnapia moabensis]